MDLSKKIKKLIENKGVTAYEVSLKSGVPHSSMSRVLSGETKKLSTKNKELLSKYFHVEEDYFNNGNISEINIDDKISSIEVKHLDAETSSIMFVPLVNHYAYGGYMNGFSDLEYIDSLPKIPFVLDKEYKGQYLCFELKGDSMECDGEESLPEGSILLCRNVKQEYWKSKLHINKWDFVIVHKEKGIVVKRITKHDVENGIITLHSLNDFYSDYDVNLSDVSQIFNIVEVQTKRKRR